MEAKNIIAPTFEEMKTNKMDLELPLASGGSRVVATIIDGVFSQVLSKICSVAALAGLSSTTQHALSDSRVTTVTLSMGIFVGFLYYILPLYMTGQTLGKKILKIKLVYSERSEMLSFNTIILREYVGKMISLIPFGGGYYGAFGPQRLTWHDKLLKTKVVDIKNH